MQIKNNLKEYYGQILQSTQSLQTSACCSLESFSPEVRRLLSKIDVEILNRFYGCGSPIPPALEGCVVLDLGCGTGRDVYLASQLVGESGQVIGVDMTAEQLAVARRHIDGQTAKFGYKKPNVQFLTGYIEDLQSIGIADNSVDVVISNCVLNLSPHKQEVFKEIFRVLKPGGELFFADVFASARVPEELQKDQVLHGECLAGALYIEDFRRILSQVGCADYRTLSSRPIAIENPEIAAKIGQIAFTSVTVRAFKLDSLEDICEDYGQVAIYDGSVPGYPHYFDLDDHHRLITGKPMLVCGNTAAMLEDTRYGRHFKIIGDRSTHYGRFDCSAPLGTVDDGACC